MTEQELKKAIKTEEMAPVYLLYGDETYLVSHYVHLLTEKAVGKERDGLGAFNCQSFDGQEASVDAIIDAAEALPLMADRKCVIVRDANLTASGDAGTRLLELLEDPPEQTVLLFWMDAGKPDFKKSAHGKKVLAALGKHGVIVEFPRKTAGDIARLLCSGATRRGCQLAPETARQLVEQCGNDLNLLLNELDKLCALAGEGGVISPTLLEAAATKNVEAQVYDLSKMILQNHYQKAYTIIHRLFAQKAEPVNVLAALSGAYADLYRAKIAYMAGLSAQQLAGDFPAYRGREFRLRYAERDCRNLSVPVLRKSLDILAKTDTQLKSSRADGRMVLEQTAARLILTAKLG